MQNINVGADIIRPDFLKIILYKFRFLLHNILCIIIYERGDKNERSTAPDASRAEEELNEKELFTHGKIFSVS